MEDVRQLVQEEGREARNLVAFHVAVDTPARISRKPPRSVAPPIRRSVPRAASRRSASAGRDKRSELRARYWALLFGDLQRAIGEIYNTVEAHENLNECQEVILVLENYTRDFKALGEWFRLKWEYDNTPPPQRPQSLAWEIRKTDFVRPESRRTYSVKSSPSVSGKNSPCLSGHNTPSGKNSPNLTGKASPGSGKISPRVPSGHSSTSPKANIEFFSNKITSKITTKPEPKAVKEPKLSDIKEKDFKEEEATIELPKSQDINVIDDKQEFKPLPVVELGKAKEYPNISAKPVVIKSPKHAKLTEKLDKTNEDQSTQAKATIEKLDAMENDFLCKQLTENQIKNDNLLNHDRQNETLKTKHDNQENIDEINVDEELTPSEFPTKSDDKLADISNESSSQSTDTSNCNNTRSSVENHEGDIADETSNNINDVNVNTSNSESSNTEITDLESTSDKDTNQISKAVIEDSQVKDDSKKEQDKKPEIKISTETKPSTRPAYSQAAAKPKTATTTKAESKTPTRSTTPLTRSKTVVEMRPSTAPKTQRNQPKRNQTSKCSYPFNLTTGRTSLFDAAPGNTNKGSVQKKPVNKNIQMASGDAKLCQNRVDLKKRPPRPTSLKINENGDQKEKMNPTLEKIKDYEEYSSSDTIVTQIDMSRIESSESLKTLVSEELQNIQDVANSIEVLNVDNNKSDNEGWLTVKSRRLSRESKKQSKSHWANRFHQPSATTSLPTLNMMESPKQENNPIVHSTKIAKTDRAMSEQPQKVDHKPEKVVKVTAREKSQSKSESKARDPAIIRQKSDVTGLRTRPARTKALRKERLRDTPKDDEVSELTKNRLHSSLESLTTGLARSQESTEEIFDFDKWKAEFKFTFKYLDEDDQMANHNEILKSADPSEMSEIAEMTSQIEENEKKLSWALDFQSEVDQRKLCEEEDLLNRQIMELQQVSDIDLDTETDDTETDAEILCEDTSIAGPSCQQDNLGALAASLEDQYETALAGMSWAERVDTLVVLEALVARDPGRAQQLHAKLSQGIKRRGSLQDALRRLQAKQARAERQRLEYQTERAKKIHQLLGRVEEVKVAKNQLIEEKRLRMERRLQKATENRDQHLKDIVRKAHDEEEKLREIAFIKQLEAENRRHDFLDQCRSHTTRLRQMRREQLTKLEQKAAREAAVGARRQALEAARKLHVETLLEKRKERDARVEELKELKKQERDDAAREKAEGVKSRLSALAAAAELEADALRSRIRDKQDASQQRLESHLQAIREKATGPRQATTSESQDQTTKELQEETQRLEQERKERDKQKAIKKKAGKVRQKLLSTGTDNFYEETSTACNHIETIMYPQTLKLCKVLQQISIVISPLLDQNNKDSKGDVNGVDVENEKGSGKGKNKKNSNGIVEVDSKKSKKKKPEDKNEFNNNIEAEVKEEVRSESKKKKKRNKESNDKSRLSKTSSVCSSLSDMSKNSIKHERKSNVIIDIVSLERQLNELHRMLEKCEKLSTHEKLTFHKMHGLKTLGQFLTVASEREDLASQFTSKSLNTCVRIISRAMSMCEMSICHVSNCQVSASHFITTNAVVHIVKLLANQLEKDLISDQKEMDLAKQLTDCLSITLDSVLCSTRLYEETKASAVIVPEILSAVRSRAHSLISYFCLSGCIARAQGAGEARESIQTLLTVCADLCHPCDVDTGSEHLSAKQSLRCALGTSLCGSRAEFCMLFAKGAGLEECGGFVRAARTAHLLRALAELDHQIVQEAFGEGGWPLEFRAAVARLLSQHAPNDREAPRTFALHLSNQRLDQTLSETMVLDLIVLVGFVIVNNPQLQETICDGWSVIRTICTLPANWLISKFHSHAVLPTLVALSERQSAACAIASELSIEMLEEYINSPDAQKVKLVQVIKQGRTKRGKK